MGACSHRCFPYNHTTLITREDADALFAYLISLPPVHQRCASPYACGGPMARKPRWPCGGACEFQGGRIQGLCTEQSDEWNRGAYLVQGTGPLRRVSQPHAMTWALPTARADDLAWRHDVECDLGMPPHWSTINDKPSLASTHPVLGHHAFATNRTQRHTHWVTGPMQEVVQHSLQYLSASDLRAMAVYLQTQARKTICPTNQPWVIARRCATQTAWQTPVPAESKINGAQLYQQALRAIVMASKGKDWKMRIRRWHSEAVQRCSNALHPVNLDPKRALRRFFCHHALRNPRPYGMPPFVLTLSDRDIADVLTHMSDKVGATKRHLSANSMWQKFEVTATCANIPHR